GEWRDPLLDPNRAYRQHPAVTTENAHGLDLELQGERRTTKDAADIVKASVDETLRQTTQGDYKVIGSAMANMGATRAMEASRAEAISALGARYVATDVYLKNLRGIFDRSVLDQVMLAFSESAIRQSDYGMLSDLNEAFQAFASENAAVVLQVFDQLNGILSQRGGLRLGSEQL